MQKMRKLAFVLGCLAAPFAVNASDFPSKTITLVVPFAHDQPDNAMRVARLGVSRTLYPRGYTDAAVARELDLLLSEGAYATRAEEVGRRVRGEAGTERACEAIERLLA